MKILHVITSLRTGGAEKLMVDLLPRLKNMGDDVELCVFEGYRTPFMDELERCGVKIHKLTQSLYSPKNLMRLIPLMKKYDVVHSHNSICQFYVAIGGLFVKCKLCTTEHNTTNRRRNNVWKIIDRWMYGRYDKVVCISELTKNSLIRHVSSVARKCEMIYNGIDIKKYECECLHYTCNLDDIRVLMVSAFRDQKDQKTLIRALNYMPSNVKVIFVGGGEKVLVEQCKSLARTLKVDDRVEFLGIRMDVPMLMWQSKIIVMSSHYEGFGLSAVEGMAAARPVVSSDVPGLHEIVGGYGVLFPHEDAKALAKEIMRLAEDREWYDNVVSKCQERARMFDIQKMAEGYRNLYYSLKK